MVRDILNTWKLIVSAPLNRSRKLSALNDWFRWQFSSRLLGWPVVVPYVNDSVLLVEPSMTGATGNIYLGLAEFDDMGFLLHFLGREDLFVDVGANIGSFTVLASKVVKAESIAIEALPFTYHKLEKNIRVNNIDDKVYALNCALGNEVGAIHFTSGLDTMNHVVAEEDVGQQDVCSVEVKKLDDILGGRVPRLIKIDVEGYETPVIEGAIQTLQHSDQVAVIMELNGCGKRYGFDDEDLHRKMLSLGYCAVSYHPMDRKMLEMNQANQEGNTIYIKKENFLSIELSVKNSDTFYVKGQNI